MDLKNVNILLKFYNTIDLKKAFQQKEGTIHIKNEKIRNSFLLANKIQAGHLPIIILKRLEGNRVVMYL